MYNIIINIIENSNVDWLGSDELQELKELKITMNDLVSEERFHEFFELI